MPAETGRFGGAAAAPNHDPFARNGSEAVPWIGGETPGPASPISLRMKPLTPIIIATLGDMQAHGYRLYGSCRDCHRSRVLDLPTLINHVGADYSLSAHGGRLPLRCESCGGRDVALSLEPGGGY